MGYRRMLRRSIIALTLLPVLSAAAPPQEIILSEAYRFGADPGRIYTLAVRNGRGPDAELKLAPPSQVGIRTLDLSGHESGRARGLVELTGPKNIWSAQRTLPGTNLDFLVASIRATTAPLPPMTPAPISFDLQSFTAMYPPPKDDQSFADHADEISWSGNWASGAPSYAKLLRQALGVVMRPPRTPQYGLKPATTTIDHAYLTQAPARQGRMVLAVARMDSDSDRAESDYWTQAVFALLPDARSHMRIITIVPAFDPAGDDGAARYRRTYRIVDLIDRQGDGTLDILLSVADEKERHLELYGWDGHGYTMIASSPRTGVPQVLDE
jgi:hypothetical protein